MPLRLYRCTRAPQPRAQRTAKGILEDVRRDLRKQESPNGLDLMPRRATKDFVRLTHMHTHTKTPHDTAPAQRPCFVCYAVRAKKEAERLGGTRSIPSVEYTPVLFLGGAVTSIFRAPQLVLLYLPKLPCAWLGAQHAHLRHHAREIYPSGRPRDRVHGVGGRARPPHRRLPDLPAAEAAELHQRRQPPGPAPEHRRQGGVVARLGALSPLPRHGFPVPGGGGAGVRLAVAVGERNRELRGGRAPALRAAYDQLPAAVHGLLRRDHAVERRGGVRAERVDRAYEQVGVDGLEESAPLLALRAPRTYLP